MSDSQMIQKLTQSVANLHEELTVEQMRLYQEFVTKSIEAREAQEALLSAMEDHDSSDQNIADQLRDIRKVFSDQDYRLSGNECVLLACLSKELEGEDYIDTKRLNIFLHSFDRKPSNTTKIVDGLEKKKLIEINSDGLHSHKMYRLTQRGQGSAWSLLERFSQPAGKLSVME